MSAVLRVPAGPLPEVAPPPRGADVIVIYAYPGGAKTDRAKRLLAHYGATRLVEYDKHVEGEREILPGDLLLTGLSRGALEAHLRARLLPQNVRLIAGWAAIETLRIGARR